ncbi:MAG: alpha/beta hydrolase [Verrucomicrobiales bacterium]
MFGDIHNVHHEKLDYRWHPAAAGSAPDHVVVIGHGVTAHLDRPFVKALAEGIAAAGLHALRFSFSGNGDSEGRFQDSCISKELDDLGAIILTLTKAGYSVSYAGHSMGGAVGVIYAAHDTRIRHLISLAGMVRTKRFAETEFGMAAPDEGFMWDDPNCPLSSTFMNDLRTIETVAPTIKQVTVPVLLVHGADDDLVPLDEAREIFALANEPKELIELPGANHVFAGAAQPGMVEAVVSWLKPRVLAL